MVKKGGGVTFNAFSLAEKTRARPISRLPTDTDGVSRPLSCTTTSTKPSTDVSKLLADAEKKHQAVIFRRWSVFASVLYYFDHEYKHIFGSDVPIKRVLYCRHKIKLTPVRRRRSHQRQLLVSLVLSTVHDQSERERVSAQQYEYRGECCLFLVACALAVRLLSRCTVTIVTRTPKLYQAHIISSPNHAAGVALIVTLYSLKLS